MPCVTENPVAAACDLDLIDDLATEDEDDLYDSDEDYDSEEEDEEDEEQQPMVVVNEQQQQQQQPMVRVEGGRQAKLEWDNNI